MSEKLDISRLQFMMKSGNSFILDGVHDYKISAGSNGITSITLSQIADGSKTRLLINTLDLSQVEAVLELPADPAPVA